MLCTASAVVRSSERRSSYARGALSATLLLLVGCASPGAPVREAPPRTHGEVTIQDGTVRYVEAGPREAPALVLVHGWCCSLRSFEKQLDGFEGFRRIALDLPGNGASLWSERKLTMDLYAEAIVAVLDDAGVERAVLVGHSDGAAAIRQVWRRAPARVAGLVVVDGALRNFYPDRERNEALFQAIAGSAGDEVFANGIVPPLLRLVREDADKEGLRSMMLATPAWVRVESFRASVDPAIWTDDPIGAPLHQVMSDSPFWTESYRRAIVALAPGSTWATIPGVSHFVMVDAPEELEREVRGFCERIDFGLRRRREEPARTDG